MYTTIRYAMFDRLVGFDWDEGNRGKNAERHGVTDLECEQVFFNHPLLVFPDADHSEDEDRFYVLGRTERGRRLFLVFTPRGDRIRVISARDMTRRERRFYPA
jgi:hypothetical protein